MRKYNYTEENFENLVFQSFDYDDSRNEVHLPPWCLFRFPRLDRVVLQY
jgi:hypothetical protein